MNTVLVISFSQPLFAFKLYNTTDETLTVTVESQKRQNYNYVSAPQQTLTLQPSEVKEVNVESCPCDIKAEGQKSRFRGHFDTNVKPPSGAILKIETISTLPTNGWLQIH
jgi:hypothetical protein